MNRDKRTLGWGLLFLFIGGIWLLHSMGIHVRVMDGLLGAFILMACSAFLTLIAAGNTARRAHWLIPAGVLAAGGVIHLGDSLHFMPDALQALLLMLGFGVPFALMYALDRRRSWALWCAWGAVIIGAAAFLDGLGRWGDKLAGPVFLWAAAVPFAVLFLRRGREWSLITAGSLVSLGFTALFDELHAPERLQGGVLLAGLAATFAATYVLGRPGTVAWARYAALGSGAVALLVVLTGTVFTVILPLGLIGAGAWLIFGHHTANGSLGPPTGEAPTPPAPPPAQSIP